MCRSRQMLRPTRIKTYAATKATRIESAVWAPAKGEKDMSPTINSSAPTAMSTADTTDVPSRNK